MSRYPLGAMSTEDVLTFHNCSRGLLLGIHKVMMVTDDDVDCMVEGVGGVIIIDDNSNDKTSLRHDEVITIIIIIIIAIRYRSKKRFRIPHLDSVLTANRNKAEEDGYVQNTFNRHASGCVWPNRKRLEKTVFKWQGHKLFPRLDPPRGKKLTT